MHGSLLNKISKEILSGVPQTQELDKAIVLQTLDQALQGLTVSQLTVILKTKFFLVVSALMALERDGLVERNSDGIWHKKFSS